MKLIYFSKEVLKEVFPLSSLKLKQEQEDVLELPVSEKHIYLVSKLGFEEVYYDSIRLEVESVPEEFKKYIYNDLSVVIADNELVYVNKFMEKLFFIKEDIEYILSYDYLNKFFNRVSKLKGVSLIKKKNIFTKLLKKTYYCMLVKDPNEIYYENNIKNNYEDYYIPPKILYKKVYTNSVEDLNLYLKKWSLKGYNPYLIKKKKELIKILEVLELATKGKDIKRSRNFLENVYAENPAIYLYNEKIELFSYKEALEKHPGLSLEEYEKTCKELKQIEEEDKKDKEEILRENRESVEDLINEEFPDYMYKYTLERLTGYTGKYIGKKPIYIRK